MRKQYIILVAVIAVGYLWQTDTAQRILDPDSYYQRQADRMRSLIEFDKQQLAEAQTATIDAVDADDYETQRQDKIDRIRVWSAQIDADEHELSVIISRQR